MHFLNWLSISLYKFLLVIWFHECFEFGPRACILDFVENFLVGQFANIRRFFNSRFFGKTIVRAAQNIVAEAKSKLDIWVHNHSGSAFAGWIAHPVIRQYDCLPNWRYKYSEIQELLCIVIILLILSCMLSIIYPQLKCEARHVVIIHIDLFQAILKVWFQLLNLLLKLSLISFFELVNEIMRVYHNLNKRRNIITCTPIIHILEILKD